MNWDRKRRRARRAVKADATAPKVAKRKNDMPLRIPSHRAQQPMKKGAQAN